MARASSITSLADSRVRPWALWPPSWPELCGVKPMWPQTTMPASRMALMRLMTRTPPSSLIGIDRGLFEEAAGVAHRLLVGDLVAHERHVADDEGVGGAAAHRLGVHDALVHGHRHRAGVAVDAHAERVADEDHVDAGLLLEGGHRIGVAGEPGDLLAALLHLVQIEHALLSHEVAPSYRPAPSRVIRHL